MGEVDLDAAIRAKLDEHEAYLFELGESPVFDDPDGGLLRYGRALRAVLDIAAKYRLASYYDAIGGELRGVVARELGVTQ